MFIAPEARNVYRYEPTYPPSSGGAICHILLLRSSMLKNTSSL